MPFIHAKLHKTNRILVTFDFDPTIVTDIKTIPGYKFVPIDKGGPAWMLPRDLTTGRFLNKLFGSRLKLHSNLREWAEEQVRRETELSSLVTADAAPLERLPQVVPKLWRAVHTGPRGRGLDVPALDALIAANPAGSYQTADVSYLARASNPLNGNQPGLGKTLETIGAIFESGMDEGPHLVLAPLTSLDSVWKQELELWQPHPVWVCEGSTANKLNTIWEFLSTDGPGWLVCNHHMAQMLRVEDEETGDVKCKQRFPPLYEIEWNSIILDEVHKAGFRDTKSLMYRGVSTLTSLKRFAISGTPIGGKPINLWHILHWLEPEEFSNKDNWARQWLYVIESEKGRRDNMHMTREYGEIRADREEDFYQFHAPFFLRRLKSEVLPDLPPKQEVEVVVEMTGRQAKQYKEMAETAEVTIADEQLSALGILAEYTRLKQFAIAECELETYWKDGERKMRPIPTTRSCKLDALEQILDERGIFEDGGEQQVVVFSQFSSVVNMIYDWLAKKKVPTLRLTGQQNKKGERAEINRAFQNKEVRVLVMTTTAGGVAITLDMADTVVFMDETWDPGDQEQASDRVHRASRIHQVTIYTIRSKHTIEDYIKKVLFGKENINKIILDLRRQGLRADKD